MLLDRLDDHAVREWYAARDVADGWSRAVWETMLANRLHLRKDVAPSNFPATLAGADSDLVQEINRERQGAGRDHQGSRWVRTSAELAEVRARRVPRISHPRLASPDTVW